MIQKSVDEERKKLEAVEKEQADEDEKRRKIMFARLKHQAILEE